jgi:hypothetical protein
MTYLEYGSKPTRRTLIMPEKNDLNNLVYSFRLMGLEFVIDDTMEAIDVLRIVQGFDKVEGLYDSQCSFIFDKTGCFIKSVIKVGRDTDPMEG